jgi:transposase InsO family protein
MQIAKPVLDVQLRAIAGWSLERPVIGNGHAGCGRGALEKGRYGTSPASYLIVMLDVFSRYIVGWTVQYRENGQLAKALIEQATEQQKITPGLLTLHADRGGPQRAKPVAFLLADLGITKTHSRPYTSSDNPYSESNFKTLKYRPKFPARFDSIEHAREHCRTFVDWYNHEHRHSGIGLMTPAAVHHGHAEQLHAARAAVCQAPPKDVGRSPSKNVGRRVRAARRWRGLAGGRCRPSWKRG